MTSGSGEVKESLSLDVETKSHPAQLQNCSTRSQLNYWTVILLLTDSTTLQEALVQSFLRL